MAADDFSTREFPMTDRNFDQICRIARDHTGISLSPHKREMVYSRLARRIRGLGLGTFNDYCELLTEGNAEEMNEFVNAITTNLTSFFREKHHFNHLRKVVTSDWAARNRRGEQLRIWSAGCSTGEEPYSIAMTLSEAGVGSDWNVKILATDLDSNVLDTARAGIYPLDRVEQMNPELFKKYFQRDRATGTGGVARIKQSLRDMITFNRLNLMDEWPMRGRFDVIFCRNVVIYFSKDTQRVLFERYAELLKDNSHLFIGHSESLSGVSERFENLGHTIYRKLS